MSDVWLFLIMILLFVYIAYSGIKGSKLFKLKKQLNVDNADNCIEYKNDRANQDNYPMKGTNIKPDRKTDGQNSYPTANYPQDSLAIIMVWIAHKLEPHFTIKKERYHDH